MSDQTEAVFPFSARVAYKHAPITQVICQLRFPTVLRISAQDPVDFQDRVRGMFPLFQRASNIPDGLPPEIAQMVVAQIGIASANAYEFHSEDRSATLALSADSISLTVRRYRLWEDFRAMLLLPLAVLAEIYRPSFYDRIGLRYQNSILRSQIGLADLRWSELLKPELLGEMADPRIEANATEARRVLKINVPPTGVTLLLQHGLGRTPDLAEVGYVIDLDFAKEQRTGVEDVEPTLESLHELVGRAFRWGISDRLHSALDPSPL